MGMRTFDSNPRTPFGKRIREERRRAQMTQKEIGDLTHIPPAYLSQLELGYEPPTPKVIAAFAEIYGIDTDELYALANRPPVDIMEKLSGSLDNIKKARKVLEGESQGTDKVEPLPERERETFGIFLRRRMEELRTNQRRLHLASGIRQGTISAWTTDKRIPDPQHCQELAKHLHLDPDDVLRRAGHRPQRDTDLHPDRAEIRELANSIPEPDLELVREFIRWRIGLDKKRV